MNFMYEEILATILNIEHWSVLYPTAIYKVGKEKALEVFGES